jgi:regulator of sigma E protease
MDLLQNVGISGENESLALLIQGPGKDGEKRWVVIRPKPMKVGKKSFPTIGIRSAATTTLPGTSDTPPVIPHLPAGSATPAFAGGDKIVAVKVAGTVLPVPDFFHLRAIMAQHVEDELTFVVERKRETDEDAPEGGNPPTTKVDIRVAANPMRRTGLVMTLGPILAIQENSPAAAAGFKVGDQIKTINGKSADDPLTISDVFQRLAGQEVEVGVLRDKEIVNLSVTPRLPTMQISYANTGLPLGIQPLGVACPVSNRVYSVEPGSPAAKAGLKPDDELLSASFVAADEARQQEEAKLGLGAKAIDLGDEQNWLLVFERMQRSLPDTKLKLTYQRASQTATAELTPYSSQQWHVASRGFFLESGSEIHTAESWGEAFSLGLRNTKESMLHVGKFLRKLVTGQIAPTNVGGPAMIFMVAGSEAKQGIPRLLLFLTLLSANLAIINFLPIPVLDGGHMLFLLYEGIVGKPVNEVWAMRLTVAGLVFILGLMAFVLSLDAYHIAQWVSQ